VNARYGVGERLFLASAGVVTVQGHAAQGEGGRPAPLRPGDAPAFYVVGNDDVTACVPLDQAERTLRPLVDRPTAERMLAVLREPAPPGPASRESVLDRGKRVVHSGTPMDHAWFLRELFGLPLPLSEPVAQGLQFFCGIVLGEISAVLGESRESLERELRSRYPAAAGVAVSPIQFRAT
jgi:RNA polymerase-interacting CarD/CdnL/TRCF family regulator